MKYILYAILIWFLYNLVFKLIIPIYKASRQMRNTFRDMQSRMQEQQQQAQSAQNNSWQQTNSGTPNKAPAEDYIDFEEIKS